MNRSITRGLAVSAVSALAVTGLSLVAAPAQAAEPDVRLISQFTGLASTRYDTSGSTTRLTARADDPSTVTFQVNPDPEAGDTDTGWQNLDASGQVAGGNYATVQWYGSEIAGRSYRGERVALRAVATNADGTSYSTRNDVEVSAAAPVDSVSINTSGASYFLQPYADTDQASAMIPVTGLTTADSGTVELSTWRNDTGEFVGRTTADIMPFEEKVPGEDRFETFGRFTGLVELTAYDIEEGMVAVAAERDSDDVAPITLTRQQISQVWASTPSRVRDGEQTDVRITVADQSSNPILGAEVRRRSDDSLVGYTDPTGVVMAEQAGDSTEEYYANATDADPFDTAEGDVTSGPVTVETYEPEATYVQPILSDGTAFDVDEYDAGDLAVAVTDSEGRPVGAGESVSYRIYRSDEEAPATYRTAVTNSDGVAVVDFDAAGASGEHRLSYVLTSQQGTSSDQTVIFTTGEADLLLSPRANPVEEAAGGRIDYFGRLVLDGEPLPNRRVVLRYARGVEVVPGNTPDASIVTADGRALQTAVTTNRNGSFRVTIDDSAESPQASEIGGVLTAATGNTVSPGVAVDPGEDGEPVPTTVDGNADTSTTSTTRFGTGEPGTARITLGGTDNGADADKLKVTGPTSLAGESIKVFRVNAQGKRLLVTTKTLDSTGDRPTIVAADGNGGARTTYVVRLLASQRVQATDSNTKALR